MSRRYWGTRSLSRWIHSRLFRRGSEPPWRSHSLPSFPLPPTMLSAEEVQLLHWLTSQQYSGRGEIIDAGCFLGGSSVALADGLKHNGRLAPQQKRQRITSYDLFLTDWYAKKILPDKQEGEDYFDRYLQNIKPYEDYLLPQKGDLRLSIWKSRPIEILFIDVAKQPDINDHLIRQFFPHLEPHTSFIIQQDYIHEWLPWIHVTMEYFAKHFTLRDYVWNGSAIYQLTRRISADECRHFSIKNIAVDEQVKLMDHAIEKIALPEQKVVTLAKVRLLHDLGRSQEAHEILNHLAQQNHDEPRVAQGIADMRSFLAEREG